MREVPTLKYVQALLMLTLLVFSRRYRQRWREATDKLGEACDFVEASNRRMSADQNGGRPALRSVNRHPRAF
jgi:hypothetical protein